VYRGNLSLRPPVPFCSQEMAAVSAFMTSQRPYPTHYMETAIKTYLNACRYVLNVPLCDAIFSAIPQPLGSVLFHVFKLIGLVHDQNNFVTASSQPSFLSCWFLRHNRVIFSLEINFWKWRGIVSPAFLVFYLTIIPRARMGYESIAHEAEGRIGYWLRGHEGERNNCFSKIELVDQKNMETKHFSQFKARHQSFLPPKHYSYGGHLSLLVGYNI